MPVVVSALAIVVAAVAVGCAPFVLVVVVGTSVQLQPASPQTPNTHTAGNKLSKTYFNAE
jgi:hypothetical protein